MTTEQSSTNSREALTVHRWVDGPEERVHRPGTDYRTDTHLRPTSCGRMASSFQVTRNERAINCSECQAAQ